MLNLTSETLADTAFWVAACRSSREDISLDIYAKYWVTQEGFIRHNDYVSKVGPYENECVSLRFRYVLETVRNWIGNGKESAVVNFAAGVSSLSVLLPSETFCFELDQKDVMDRKREFYKSLGKTNVSLNNIDLSNCEEVKTFFDNLKSQTSEKNRLVLVFEGILYYLDKKVIDFIFKQISGLPKDQQILVVANYWPKKLRDLPIFDKFIKFTENNVSKSDFTFFSPEEISIVGFEIKEIVDYHLLYRQYLNVEIPGDNIFYEEFVVLERGSGN